MLTCPFSKKKLWSLERPRAAEVGWALLEDKAAMMWEDPKPFERDLPKPQMAKTVRACPAVMDYEDRFFTVPAPFDIYLRFVMNEKGPGVQMIDAHKSSIRESALGKLLNISPKVEWRHPDRPVLQIMTPYVFFADEPVWINQESPSLDYIDPAWPGILIGGRFPVHIWPRRLMWAFEWHDISKPIYIRRGAPWFYARFDTENPAQQVRLFEGELTPEIKKFMDGIGGVTNHVNRTFSLFDIALRRRPRRLLIKKT